MKSLIYRDEAVLDIGEAMRWYREQLPGLEERFLEEILACEAVIIRHPRGAPLVYKHFRQLPLKGFPYVMLYGIHKGNLYLYRVFPTRMDPAKKYKR